MRRALLGNVFALACAGSLVACALIARLADYEPISGSPEAAPDDAAPDAPDATLDAAPDTPTDHAPPFDAPPAESAPPLGAWGGIYQRDNAPCTDCARGNPFADGACTCPSGFTGVELLVINDCNASDFTGSRLTYCYGARAPGDTFGGAYYVGDENAACGAIQGCTSPNPFTDACSCPAGTAPVGLRALTECMSGPFGGTMSVCVDEAGRSPSFGGVYAVSDPDTCDKPNPLTDACACANDATAPEVLRIQTDAFGGRRGGFIVVCPGTN